MENKPYLGITGCSSLEEAIFCSVAFKKFGLSKREDFKPMLGFLISHKIFDERKKYPHNNRYVDFSTIFKLLWEISKENIFRTIHYNTRAIDFADEIIKMLSIYGELESMFEDVPLINLVDGIQLNIESPKIEEIKKLKKRFPKLSIIIQIDSNKLDDPSDFWKLREYNIDEINYILIDPSRGEGRSIDLISSKSVTKYLAIKNIFSKKTLGFAGGFSHENIRLRYERIKGFYRDYPFCIDSESRLRDDLEDKMDLLKIDKYISEFMKAIKNQN